MIRCWEPRDAPLLKEAIDTSLDHLRPWMAWAHAEPQTLTEKVSLLRRFRGEFDLGRDFVYAIFDRHEREVLGGTGLHPRSRDDSFEIGYWVRASHTGRGLATETSAALTRVAFEICEVDRIDIRVDRTNEASLRIPHKLGFTDEATLRRRLPPHDDGVPRDVMLFSLFHDDFVGSSAATAAVEAYDLLGKRVL